MATSSKIVDQHIPCPSCTSSDGYCTYSDGHGYCFSCKYNYQPNSKESKLNYTYEHLPWRGVSKGTMAFFDVKTKIDPEGKPISLGYRWPDGHYNVRLIDKKEFYIEGTSKPGLFGMDKFTPGTDKYCTITEGAQDALSFRETGVGGGIFAAHSSGSAARDVGACRSDLNQYEKIYLALDGDAPGKAATAEVARLFDYSKVYVVRFDARRKDAGEFVRRGEVDDLRTLWHSSKHYLPETVISSFGDFEHIVKQEHTDGIPYPFPTLTEMTYGIHTGETTLITAQEGVGKTEFMHAVEYKILRETDYNVASIFLEEPKRRHLQALAGIHLQSPVHLPDSGHSDDEVLSAIRDVVVKDDRLHLYNHFGHDDPEVLLDSIRFLVTARNCRVVLFDHINLAVSGSTEMDERRQLDYLATRLEMMVKELDFALVMVSHVNDAGQTRSSRWPSKMADIKINLERDIETQSNVVHFKITKPSRLTGRSGPAGSYIFNPITRRYSLWEETDGFGTSAANENNPPPNRLAV